MRKSTLPLLTAALILLPLMMLSFSENGGSREKEGTAMSNKNLTPEEERVIVYKGTEPPFSGKYDNFYADGIYACKRCGAGLYRSDDKFKSGCGWPSFDAELPGAVIRQPDKDKVRIEILCANCDAHLGHVFIGEWLTPRNARHCVNSVSLEFISKERLGRAVFAGGCFWGVQYFFQKEAGVISTIVGFAGGNKEKPSYKQVCEGNTGHAEVVEITFDKDKTDYAKLLKLFFAIHDPSQVDRQGPDVGKQYRSAIFPLDQDQQSAAEKVIAALKAKGVKVATAIEPGQRFWPAEAYHQHYFRSRGMEPHCHLNPLAD